MTETKDIEAIERLSDKLATSLNNKDLSAVDGLAAPNAVLLAPARNLVRSASAVHAAWRNMALRYSGVRFLATVLEPLGSEAFLEVGTFSARPQRAGEERVFFKYQFVWQKHDGDWKLASMAWNRPAAEGKREGGKPEPSSM